LRIEIYRYDTLDSTNDIALQMVRKGSPEGTCITARRQLKGRGRRGRVWFDSAGESVLMSIIFRPKIPLDRFHELSFVVSFAVAEHLRTCFGVEAVLKWPNDVLARGMKIAGVLIEIEHATGAAIAGVGININQRELPPSLAQRATSVLLETSVEHDVTLATETFARAIADEYERYIESGFKDIRARWLNNMWGLGKWAEVRLESEALVGIIAGLDKSGALLLRDGAGTVHTIHAADVVMLR